MITSRGTVSVSSRRSACPTAQRRASISSASTVMLRSPIGSVIRSASAWW